nr:NSP1 [Rotavirus A type 2]
MSVYREALYWYNKHIRTKNHRLLRNVSTFAWRNADTEDRLLNLQHIPITKNKVISHCLTCCTLARLFPCRVCKIRHTCANCLSSCECFLSDRTTQLRMRTLRYKIMEMPNKTTSHLKTVQKEHIANIMKFYLDTFPINDTIIAASKNKTSQHKCRSDYMIWAQHLALPLCTLAKVIRIYDDIYYIFGHYEHGTEINAPYQTVNFFRNDMLIDEMNMERMAMLHEHKILNQYAYNAFRLTRKLNPAEICVNGAMYLHNYGDLQYSKRLNFIYTACVRANDAFAVSQHNEWNDIYPNYCQLVSKKSASSVKREKLNIRSAIVLQYANSAVYATALWNRIVSMTQYKCLFCLHWFVDPVDTVDEFCDHIRIKRKLPGITSPSMCNMLFELHALMKSMFTVGMYTINGKFACSKMDEMEITMLRNEMLAENILTKRSDFKRWIKSRYVLMSDYSPFIYDILNEMGLDMIPITNPYSGREQKMTIFTPSSASEMITRVASFILETELSGEFRVARTVNQYCRTDRYVEQALHDDSSDTSDVD